MHARYMIGVHDHAARLASELVWSPAGGHCIFYESCMHDVPVLSQA